MLETLKETNSLPEEKVPDSQVNSFTDDIIRVVEWGITGAAFAGRYGAGCSGGAAAGSIGGPIGSATGCAVGMLTVFVLSGATKKLAKVGVNFAKENAGKLLRKLDPIMLKGKKLFDDIEVRVKELPKSVFYAPDLYKGLTTVGGLSFQNYETPPASTQKETADINEDTQGYKFLGVQPTLDFSLDEKKEPQKPVIPLSGLVVPRIKILYVNGKDETGQLKLADLAIYLGRIISLNWLDAENETNIPSVSISCAYHPDIMRLDTSVWVLIFVGTHEGKMLNLGTFYLKEVGKTFSHGSYIAHLLFTTVTYKTAVTKTVMPKNQCVKVETYMDRLDQIVQSLKFKKDIKGAEQKLNQPFNLELDYDTNTPLFTLSHMAKALQLNFTIRNKTIILRDKNSDEHRVTYLIPLSVASSFDIKYELNNTYDIAQVVSSKITKEKKPIIGVAKAKIRTGEQGTGQIFTKHIEAKDEKEAKDLANLVLDRVNSTVMTCSMTIPNCLIYAGNNVIVNQSLPTVGGSWKEPPLFLRIQEARHEISASRWAVTLKLVSVPLSDDKAKIELFKKIKALVDKMNANTKEFESLAMNESTIKTMLKSASAGTKLSQEEQYNLLYATSISKNSYPVTGGATSVNLSKALKKFVEKSQEIDKELGKLGSSLLTENINPNATIEQAFHTYNMVALTYFGMSGTVAEKEDNKKD